ncbi:MAG: RNase J family beta-CASP ribonuclease [Clostridia bacterium]|nr:RNase J family beta-CASP ribonuclease [Clostridia bacterium]
MENTKNKKTTVKNYNTDEKINKISDSKSESVKTKKIRKSDTIKSSNTNRRFQRERSKKTNSKSLKSMKVVFLGGLNQIGKNITAFECDNEIIIVDCGMSFPDGEMLGVDLVIPDFSYLEANRDKIKGLVVTHGHEDHIGAIPYLLNKINVPIYATPLTIGLITSKLKENRLLGSTKLTTVMPGETINLGCMNVEFIRVNHSIPDAVGLAIHSPAGTIVHTGDFKIDCTPSRGEMIDLARFAELGKDGVLALMADSTNAERPGYTMTERKLDQSFERLFQKAKNKRIIIATFASNIGRIQQIINCAANYGKKVAFSGRSMVNYVAIAQQMNYLDAPDGVIIDIDLITKYAKNEVVLVTTGSQGEPMSALHRMALSEHRKVEVGPEDFIIISATPIPGNEKMVGNVVNELMKLGCEVVYESMYEIHVSGHACQEELKIIQSLVKPQYFIPVHGERRHLVKHAELATSIGMPDSNVYVGDTGDVLEINKNSMKKIGQIPLELVLVDGIGVGDVGSIVLRDRKHLGEDGLIVLVATLNSSDKRVVAGPDIVSRGFVYVRESEHLMAEARRVATKVLESCAEQKLRDWSMMKTKVRDELYRLFHNRTRRNPVILPIIMEV